MSPKALADVMALAEAAPHRTLDRESYGRYLPLVRRTALQLARRIPSTIEVSDLLGYGWIGLMEAYQRSDPGMPREEFEAYAHFRVRGAMLDHLRSLDPSSRAQRRASRGVARAIADLASVLGREPEDDEVARKLELTVADYRDLAEKVALAGAARLELLDLQDMDLPCASGSPEEEADRLRLIDAVAYALPKLSRRLGQVVTLYYRDGRMLREIAETLGVSESRVSQLLSEAIDDLRAAIQSA